MSQNNETFYEVTMRVEVKRRVLASSESEAREKVDMSDMIHEIKNYRLDEEIIVEEMTNAAPPTEYDRIDDIGEQIVQYQSEPMYMLRERYAEIRNLNRQLELAGNPPYEPAVFMHMTDDFLRLLREV